MNEKKPFSITDRLLSFSYAWQGIISFFRSEHNARIHLAGTVVATCLSILLKISVIETVAIVIVIGLVWITELINTAIENTMDHISTAPNPSVKVIKDLAAASVLVAAIIALITGCIIFIPKF